MLMPNRHWVESDSSGYMYGFNGMGKDDEFNGVGNSYTTFFRSYDARIGMWLSLDPVVHAWLSPYNSFDGNPIVIADPSGADGESRAKKYADKNNGVITTWKNKRGRTIYGVQTIDINKNGEIVGVQIKRFRDNFGDKLVKLVGNFDNFMKHGAWADIANSIDQSLDGQANGGKIPDGVLLVLEENPAYNLVRAGKVTITGTDINVDELSEADYFFIYFAVVPIVGSKAKYLRKAYKLKKLINHGATTFDWANKGAHVNMDGVEVAIKVIDNKLVVGKAFSHTRDALAEPASKKLVVLIKGDLATRKKLIDQAEKAIKFIETNPGVNRK